MSIDPHKPIPWPMQVQPQQRGDTTLLDSFNLNVIQEKMADGSVHSFKRPAFVFANAGVDGYARGAHQRLFLVGHNIYSIVTQSLLGTLGTATDCQATATFADLDFTGGNTFINSGFRSGQIFFIATSTVASVTGPLAHHGGPYAPGVVWLNGTVYLMTYSGQIYGSNVGDYTTWQSGNVISTNVQASVAMALAKQKVYIISFSRFATTVFYNAGNPTGSPLTLLPGGQSSIGLYDHNTLQSIGDDLYWVGSPSTVNLGVYKMSDLKISKVSTPAVDRLLANATYCTYMYNLVGPEPAFLVRSATFASMGHRFYVLNLYSQGISLVYDTELGLWYTWQTPGFTALPYFTPHTYGGNMATESFINFTSPQLNRFQHTQGGIYQLSHLDYQDLAGIYQCRIVTDNFDAGTRVKKVFKRFDFMVDQHFNQASSMTVEHSEDDYLTWSQPRTVNLGVKHPHLDNLGTFRRRAYRFTHAANTPFRLKGAMAHLLPGSI